MALALAAGTGTAAAQTTLTAEQVQQRHTLRVFGNVLVSAAQHGAELLGLRVRQIDPAIILLSSTAPRAEGFVLDGYGVFFHIEIPGINPAVEWAMQTRGRDQAAEAAVMNINRWLQTIEDPQERAELQRQMARIAQRLLPPGALQNRAGAIPAGMSPSPETAPPPMLENPGKEYRRLVTEQLINAMLDHSHQLRLGTDEWLMVAARGSQGPLVPEAVLDDSVPLMLRIKGSDLAEFRAGRITRDEARARVVVREF